MNYIKCLIETAIMALQDGKTLDEFKNMGLTQNKIQYVHTSAEELWAIAHYFLYDRCIDCWVKHKGVN